MLARARSNAYWPGIAHDVLKLCIECEICAEYHANPGINTSSYSEAFSSGFKYGADIGEIDGHPHLIVVDYYSFAIFECPLPSLATNSVITVFKMIFSDTGIPKTLITDNTTCFLSEEFSEFAQNWNFTHITLSPRYPKDNTHAEKAVSMVKCEDPLFGMLVLKTVPLLDVKELPDKIFFGCTLNANLPRPGTLHRSYEERYINQDDSGNLSSIRCFKEHDPVWVKISEHFP